MHHIRSIKHLRKPMCKSDFFSRQMVAINRKQIALCKYFVHHTRGHNNTWSEAEKSPLKKQKNRSINHNHNHNQEIKPNKPHQLSSTRESRMTTDCHVRFGGRRKPRGIQAEPALFYGNAKPYGRIWKSYGACINRSSRYGISTVKQHQFLASTSQSNAIT